MDSRLFDTEDIELQPIPKEWIETCHNESIKQDIEDVIFGTIFCWTGIGLLILAQGISNLITRKKHERQAHQSIGYVNNKLKTVNMGKASRLFATEKMKQAAREFREHAQANEFLHPDYGEVDEDKLLEDYFLAGAVWYKTFIEQQNKTN